MRTSLVLRHDGDIVGKYLENSGIEKHILQNPFSYHSWLFLVITIF